MLFTSITRYPGARVLVGLMASRKPVGILLDSPPRRLTQRMADAPKATAESRTDRPFSCATKARGAGNTPRQRPRRSIPICRSVASAKIGAVPAPGPSSWLNPKLIVRESRIAGLGLFTIAPVEHGEVCCRLAGELMTDERFRMHVAGRARYSALAVDERLHLVQSDDDPTTKGNHSCDPNMWLADSVTVVARRPIAAGDEATIDYALLTVEPTWSMVCNCGSALCRELVRGEDWRLSELRARYEGHWSPFIERRIRTEGQSA
jgi:uncharacterized protein